MPQAPSSSIAVRRVAHLLRRHFSHVACPAEFRDYFVTNDGPTIAVDRSLADQPGRQAALDEDLAELGRRFDVSTDGATISEWEYLLITARVR